MLERDCFGRNVRACVLLVGRTLLPVGAYAVLTVAGFRPDDARRSLAILTAVLGVHLLGGGLRDVLDPHRRK